MTHSNEALPLIQVPHYGAMAPEMICSDPKISQTFFGSIMFPTKIWIPLFLIDFVTGGVREAMSKQLRPALEYVIRKKGFVPANFMVKNVNFNLRSAISSHEVERLEAPQGTRAGVRESNEDNERSTWKK